MPEAVVILGCGYTGTRVASLLLARGVHVIATTRHPESLRALADQGAKVVAFDASDPGRLSIPAGARILHSVPIIEPGAVDPTPRILAAFDRAPARIVYLSTTGVYGSQRDVDEKTLPAPNTERERLRVDAERAVQAGAWSSLVLRPAAIYGPDRGIHVAMREGRFQLAGAGDNFVSRIHVDDLAAHVEAALFSEVTGAYPVGDEHPCTSREIAEYCARAFHLPMPASAPPDRLHETRRADRRVNGSAIRELLGITLRYPSYREGLA
jgi:nucleoside-diphosphate-sugar epimerase